MDLFVSISLYHIFFCPSNLGRRQSGNKHLIIVSDRKDEKNFEITIDYGQAEYYMGDYELESKDDYEEKIMKSNYLGLYYFDEDGSVAESKTITYEQARNDFGIDAIDIQYSQPVSNKFERGK